MVGVITAPLGSSSWWCGDNTQAENRNINNLLNTISFMRFLDFLIYYTTALYEKKTRGNLYWSSPIKRGAFNVTLTLMLWSFAAIMLLTFLILRINIIFIPYIKIILPLFGLVIYQLIAHIYIKNERYELITSSSYKSFDWGEKAGATVSFSCFTGGILAVLLVEMLTEVLK